MKYSRILIVLFFTFLVSCKKDDDVGTTPNDYSLNMSQEGEIFSGNVSNFDLAIVNETTNGTRYLVNFEIGEGEALFLNGTDQVTTLEKVFTEGIHNVAFRPLSDSPVTIIAKARPEGFFDEETFERKAETEIFINSVSFSMEHVSNKEDISLPGPEIFSYQLESIDDQVILDIELIFGENYSSDISPENLQIKTRGNGRNYELFKWSSNSIDRQIDTEGFVSFDDLEQIGDNPFKRRIYITSKTPNERGEFTFVFKDPYGTNNNDNIGGIVESPIFDINSVRP